MRKYQGGGALTAAGAAFMRAVAEAGPCLRGRRRQRIEPRPLGLREMAPAASSLAAALLIGAAPARGEGPRMQPIPIAVADFDYVDTSGEARDQRADHEARLQAFMRAVRADLAGSGQYRVVALVCSRTPCPGAGSAEFKKDALASGAQVVFYVGIHKESTLLQWMKDEAVEVETGRQVFARLMTFRGDTDESWMHSERFLIKQIMEAADLKAAEHR
jgi:coenzyme F420-reducing hydrogenase delta subunit